MSSKAAGAAVRGTGMQPYPEGVGFRFHILPQRIEGAPLAHGYYDFVRVADGLYARVVEAEVLDNSGSRSPGDDWLKIDVYTSGAASLVFEGVGQVDLRERWCNVHLHPVGVSKGEWVPNGTRVTGLMLYVHRSFLDEQLAGDERSTPRSLSNFVRGASDSFLFERAPVSSPMARAMNEIIAAPYTGGLRRMFLEARCLDILTAVMTSMNDEPAEQPVRTLSKRDQTRIEEARAILDKQFDSPPGIMELARKVGVNQQKLKVGFKQIVGTTISAYCQELRLSAAWRLLQESDLSVTQVAYEVGYEFPTNFATAFKRRYGVSPHRFRKSRGAAI